MAKTAAISARIDETIKSEAEQVFQLLGLTSSQAITLFYRQVALYKGLPFPVRLSERGGEIAQQQTGLSSVRGKYAYVQTSSDDFANRKQVEIDLEG